MAGETLCVRNVRTGKEWKQSVTKHLVTLGFSADGQTLSALNGQPILTRENPAAPNHAAIDHAAPNTIFIWKAGVTHEGWTRLYASATGEGEMYTISFVVPSLITVTRLLS